MSNQLNSPIVAQRDFLTGFWVFVDRRGAEEGAGLTVILGFGWDGGRRVVVLKPSGVASCKPLDHRQAWRIVPRRTCTIPRTEEDRNFFFLGIVWSRGVALERTTNGL